MGGEVLVREVLGHAPLEPKVLKINPPVLISYGAAWCFIYVVSWHLIVSHGVTWCHMVSYGVL